MTDTFALEQSVGSLKKKLVLASASKTRAQLLSAAGVPHKIVPSHIDEEEIKISMQAIGAPAVDIAEVLAEAKAKSVSLNMPSELVLGADQVLVFRDQIFNKPVDRHDALRQLQALRGHEHELISYAVIVESDTRIWQSFSTAKLIVRPDVTDSFLNKYVDAVGADIFNGPGAYRVEALGVQLFSEINGSHYTILGLPMLALLDYLRKKGVLEI